MMGGTSAYLLGCYEVKIEGSLYVTEEDVVSSLWVSIDEVVGVVLFPFKIVINHLYYTSTQDKNN